MKLMSSLISRLVSSLFEKTQQADECGHQKMKSIQTLVTDIRDCKGLVEGMEEYPTEYSGHIDYYPLFREVRFSTELRLLLSSAGYYSRVHNGGVVVRVRLPSKKVVDVFARLMVRRGWQCEAVFYSF